MICRGIHSSAVVESHGELTLPESTIIEPLSVIYLGKGARLALGEMNTIYPGTTIRIDQGWMETGTDVSFGPGCHIYELRGGLKIGDFTMIGGGVVICGVNHGCVRLDVPMRQQPAEVAAVEIGRDVWIGMAAVILPGVKIGDGAIVGAGAVVTSDVPERGVVHGIPARLQRFRR